MRGLFLAVLLLLAGCCSAPRYVEGTTIQLGAYVPLDGNLYGVELASYVSGCVVTLYTNAQAEITREYCATNSWFWGALHSVESSETRVTVR